jgi:hypothetical protein
MKKMSGIEKKTLTIPVFRVASVTFDPEIKEKKRLFKDLRQQQQQQREKGAYVRHQGYQMT